MFRSQLAYTPQTGNRDGFLYTDFGLREFSVKGVKERLAHYRRFVYEKGGLVTKSGDLKEGFELPSIDRFRYCTRFTDSGIIGTKDFVYRNFKGYLLQSTRNAPSLFKAWMASFLSNGFPKT